MYNMPAAPCHLQNVGDVMSWLCGRVTAPAFGPLQEEELGGAGARCDGNGL